MKRLLPALFLLSFSAAVCAENELEIQASNFFRDLKAASPNLSARLKQDPVLWDKMISAAIPGMIPAEKQKPTAPKEKAPLYPARLIAQNTIFYARLDRIDEQSLQKLMAEMRITARIANRPVGAILDLRSADNCNTSTLKILFYSAIFCYLWIHYYFHIYTQLSKTKCYHRYQ